MATKADLRVILGIDKAGFDKSLASATASVNRFSRQSAMAGKQAKTLLGNAGLGGFAKMSPYIAGAAALGKAIGDIAANGRALETSLAHLQSLTGLGSDVMGRVKQMATDTAMKVGISSQEIVDSYGVIGSKMPELLKTPEALNQVAEAAATLAKAGVMPLEGSIESLTGIMNQMGASASEAEVYINVLAAGSKNGAGNIEYLATAFTKAGSAIKNAGLTVQEGTALIEALAKRMPDAAEAGTALRNVLLVLSTTAGDDLNPKIVGLEKAMENLHARIGDTNEMVKLFGKRNYTAAAILADSTEQVKSMTDAVTGTSEAYDQAEVNGKTLDAQLNKLDASWKTLTASIGESCGWLAEFIRLCNDALQGMALFMRNNVETRIADHEKKANDWVHKHAEDRYKHYLNDRDTKGNLRYNEKQAREETIKELIAQATEYKKEGDKWVKVLNDLRQHGVTGGPAYKDRSERLAYINNDIRAFNREIKRLREGPSAAPAKAPQVVSTGGGRVTPRRGGSRGSRSTQPSYVQGSLKDYEAQLTKLKTTLQSNVDVTQLSREQIEEYSNQFSELYQKISDAKKALEQFDKASDKIKGVGAAETKRDNTSFVEKPSGVLTGIKLPISEHERLYKLQQSLNHELELTNELFEGIGSAMGEVGGFMMKTFGDITNIISVFNSEVGDTKAKIGAMGQALSSAGQAVSAIGSAMEDKGLQIGGLIAQTIGNLALSFAMAMKESAKLGPIGWTAFGIAGLAQLIAMIAQIKSISSGYASGGIIPGNSYHGDQMYVRANAGEMILTQGQQSRLFRMLDGGIYNGGAGQVEFVISGSQLKGVLNNYSRKTGKLA